MAAKFERNQAEAGLALLRTRPAWWRDVPDYRLEDHGGKQQPLCLAAGMGYFDACVEGQPVMEAGFQGGNSPPLPARLGARNRHKFMHEDAEGQALITFGGEQTGGKPCSKELFDSLEAGTDLRGRQR